MKRSSTTWLLTIAICAACGPEKIPNPNWRPDAGGGTGGDSGTSGSGGTGGDSGHDLDAGGDAADAMNEGGPTCATTCANDTPHCDEALMACVACLVNDHCVGNSAGEVCHAGACVECVGAMGCTSGQVCKTGDNECVECNTNTECSTNVTDTLCATDNTCVQCLADTDCNDPLAAKCNTSTHTCVPCDDNAQCSGITDKSICDNADGTGECVECTVTTEAPCNGNSCNPATKTCTTTPVASVGTCGACKADSECINAQARCVAMIFNGTAREGGYCLRAKGNTDCTRPFNTLINATSLSGAAAQDYCGVVQTLTTCEAVLDMIAAEPCSGDDSACGVTGVADGLCATVGGSANLCTYPCGNAGQCSDGQLCTVDTPYCH